MKLKLAETGTKRFFFFFLRRITEYFPNLDFREKNSSRRTVGEAEAPVGPPHGRFGRDGGDGLGDDGGEVAAIASYLGVEFVERLPFAGPPSYGAEGEDAGRRDEAVVVQDEEVLLGEQGGGFEGRRLGGVDDAVVVAPARADRGPVDFREGFGKLARQEGRDQLPDLPFGLGLGADDQDVVALAWVPKDQLLQKHVPGEAVVFHMEPALLDVELVEPGVELRRRRPRRHRRLRQARLEPPVPVCRRRPSSRHASLHPTEEQGNHPKP
mmetsp:Transcript_27162/g.87768  ORF Transcript_27162/g.87768 Transcript_27162/m.87768 type:complete len:268 (-) Transcript_27162:1009-1812(-)